MRPPDGRNGATRRRYSPCPRPALLHDSDNPKRISKLRFWGKNAESMESVSYQHSCNNAELIGNVAPVEYEMNYYRSQEGSLEMARLN